MVLFGLSKYARLVAFHWLMIFGHKLLIKILIVEFMEKIRENVAGIDIGAKELFVYVEDQGVKSFLTFTEDMEALAKFLHSHNIETVAMEATGVYWNILFEILEESGIEVWLVDGRETKQVPGRKTDVKDCQWIQELHSYGLLKRCFVAKDDIKELRSYQRLREDHIHSASMHINHMQKALIQMNIRLKETISQIHGVSGLKVIDAILNGERDKEVLLQLCDTRIIKNKKEDVLKALNGKYTREGLFALQQAYDAFSFYQKQIAQCDHEIEKIIHKMGKGKKDKDLNQKRKPIRHNKPDIRDLGANMLDIFEGKDATVISGITDYTWMQLLSETGTDMSRWPTPKHFTSWLGLAPGQNWSGKKRNNKRKQGRPKAGQIFRGVAQSLINSQKIALGAYGRRLRSRKGPAKAIKAMARKLAEIYWKVMVKGIEYVEIGIKNYEDLLLTKKRQTLDKLAKELNCQILMLQPVT
jgi:transposase